MSFGSLEEDLANAGLNIGFEVREKINLISPNKRGELTTSVLKPPELQIGKSRLADAVGEEVIFEHLKKLSKRLERRIKVVINPEKDQLYEIGNYKDSQSIYSYADAVDGTIKVAGLGPDLEKNIYRVGNNGCWATGIAFTSPMEKDLSELLIGDFTIAAIVDGNPTLYRSYPTNAFVYPDETGKLQTYERGRWYYKLGTSSQTNLGQATILFDAFQAHDRKSAKTGSEELAVEIFKRIINRNEGGAFDIVRLYANMGEILRQCLERTETEKGYKIEPQSVGSITINENLPNLIPITPIIEGAGGYVVDFNGNLIREKKLKGERPNVITAANETIRDKILQIVQQASYAVNLIYLEQSAATQKKLPTEPYSLEKNLTHSRPMTKNSNKYFIQSKLLVNRHEKLSQQVYCFLLLVND